MSIQRPCINCKQLTTHTTRCETCQAIYNRAHPKPERPHYKGNYRSRAKQVRQNATHCWLCGQPAKPHDPWTADHIIAGDPLSPLAPAHKSCNSRRGNKPHNPTPPRP